MLLWWYGAVLVSAVASGTSAETEATAPVAKHKRDLYSYKYPNVKLLLEDDDEEENDGGDEFRIASGGAVEGVEGAGAPTEPPAPPETLPAPPPQHGWNGKRVRDLHKEYRNIFSSGNRNAASHKWASFLIQRSASLGVAKLAEMFSGFCAVSGSPVHPSQYTRYRLTLGVVPPLSDKMGRKDHEG